MRLIDADALEYHKQLECMGNGQYEDVKVVYECDIDNAPTIDAEPVVHCKDCKHYIDPQIEDELGVRCVQWHTARFTCEDDFCSYGERREP